MLNITRDEDTKRELEIIDIKLETLLDYKEQLENDIQELHSRRKKVLKNFYKKCEEEQNE